MGMIVTWVVLLAVYASAVSSKVGNYDKHESGSYEKPKKCCKFKELTQEKQDKTYTKALQDFNAETITRLTEEVQQLSPPIFDEDRGRLLKIYRTFIPNTAVFGPTNFIEWSFDGSKKNGPETWCKLYPGCNGKNQSPIRINTKHVKCDKDLTDFYYRGYDSIPKKGLSVFHLTPWQSVTFEPVAADITIRSDWFDSDFTLYYIFLTTGSVHQIDKETFPLQIGLAHWNSHKYATQLEAENHSDGVVILNVLVEKEEDENKLDQQVADAFDNLIAGTGNTTYFPNFPLIRLIPPCRIYYKYQGSYTVPNCGESVTWAIFKQPLKISEKQYHSLNNAMSGTTKKLKNVSRPLQPLNGRIVHSIC